MFSPTIPGREGERVDKVGYIASAYVGLLLNIEGAGFFTTSCGYSCELLDYRLYSRIIGEM